MLRSRFTCLFLGVAMAAACDRVEPPTAPVEDAGARMGKLAESFARANFRFRNQTGQPAQLLVVEFNATLVEVRQLYCSAGCGVLGIDVSGATATIEFVAAPPLAEELVSAMVEGKSIRVKRWYWAALDGSVLGAVNKGCSEKDGCKQAETPAGFRIVSPPVEIAAYSTIAYCYHFRNPNLADVAIRQWKSRLGPGVLRMNVNFTASELEPPGTLSAANCDPLALGTGSHWAYTAYAPDAEYTFPGDDGTGSPLGMVLPPLKSGYLYILYENLTETPITSQVEVEAVAHDPRAVVTPAASFVTFNQLISIPPGATADVETWSCTVPDGAKFFWMSTYSHKQSIHSYIRDGTTTVFESTNFADPGAATWNVPFFTFTTGELTYEFVYANTGDNATRTVTTGSSYATDEIGAALTYFFPSTTSRFCLTNQGPF